MKLLPVFLAILFLVQLISLVSDYDPVGDDFTVSTCIRKTPPPIFYPLVVLVSIAWVVERHVWTTGAVAPTVLFLVVVAAYALLKVFEHVDRRLHHLTRHTAGGLAAPHHLALAALCGLVVAFVAVDARQGWAAPAVAGLIGAMLWSHVLARHLHAPEFTEDVQLKRRGLVFCGLEHVLLVVAILYVLVN